MVIEEKLKIKKFNEYEFENIIELFQKHSTKVSIPDCSVWLFAKFLNALLLSGDARLKKLVNADGINVSGMLYIFTSLVENNLISISNAVSKLESLLMINRRLPKRESDELMRKWKNEI